MYINSLHAYTMITSNHDSGICIYSVHVYTMITCNHDSGTCISIVCTKAIDIHVPESWLEVTMI
jgi:hypothetical protein